MKHLMENKEFRFNEVLFEHRNKEYGAYVLRNESGKILAKALFVGVSLLAAISVTPLILNAFTDRTPVHVPTDGPPVVLKLKKVEQIDRPLIEKVKPVKPVSPPNTKQYNTAVAEPKADAVEPLKIEKPADAVAGLTDNLKGDPVKPNAYVVVPPIIGTGTTPVKDPVIVPKEDPSKIVEGDELSVEASYEGGINAFRDKVMNKFDTSGFEDSNGIVKTTVTFIVETNGTISGIKADGKDVAFNSEAARVIKQIKGSWKPGKNKKGQAVRSYFRFPISMKFEN